MFNFSSIKCIDGRYMSVNIAKEYPEVTFLDLKVAICENYQIPINQQRLILCGHIVLDNETLKEKKVLGQTCLHLVLCEPQDMQA